MKWALYWTVEDEDGNCFEYEDWAHTWEEATGYFMSWIAKTSDVIKGEVICYLGDEPYGNGKPCLYFNVYVEDNGDEENE